MSSFTSFQASQSTAPQVATTAPTKINFADLAKSKLAYAPEQPVAHQLRGFKVSQNPSPIVFISDTVETAVVHYTDYDEFRGYTKCNGENCSLCRIGNKAAKRHLMPVYNPLSQVVEVLSMGDNQSPTALLPQLLNLVKFEQEQLFMVSRENYKFTVNMQLLPATLPLDQQAIQTCTKQLDENEIALSDIYRSYSNEELADFPSVRTMLSLLSPEQA